MRMIEKTIAILVLMSATLAWAQASPDGRLAVEFKINGGSPVYAIRLDDKPVLRDSRLGLVRDNADFSRGLSLVSSTGPEAIEDQYEQLVGKRRINTYRANRQVYHLQTADGKRLDVTFQVSNDGVAFRYTFPEQSTEVHRISSEVTSFHLLPGTTAWLQPMSVAKTGYARSNPSYEEYYQKEIPAGTASTLGAGWVFPALFHSGDTWIAISEAGLGRNYCGTRLGHESPDGEYSIALADPRETMNGEDANPHSTLPWNTPWRIIAIGSLKTIVESTLGTDVADKPAAPADASIKPGKSSWSWALLGDRRTNYDTQKQFIDYAADMGWQYCLVDALWDTQIGYERIKELADYGATKNVGLILWYNSAGDWNDTRQTPKDKMLTHESRIAEFEKLKAMGIKGLKVDFFAGDGQPMIQYYHDILTDAAPYGLLMNFHGATLPRGWQRTYPHLMTMESIKGFEFITGNQANANQVPTHATTIPFTRNLFDPMDFTPVCLDRLTNARITRRTTSGFELALTVIFTSGIQHYVEIPQGMAKMPEYVRDYMKHVPAVWDDTKFIDGYPGKYVVLARSSFNHWYVAAINSEATEKTLTLDLSGLPQLSSATLITDGAGDERFRQEAVTLDASRKVEVTLKPNGGMVLVGQ